MGPVVHELLERDDRECDRVRSDKSLHRLIDKRFRSFSSANIGTARFILGKWIYLQSAWLAKAIRFAEEDN